MISSFVRLLFDYKRRKLFQSVVAIILIQSVVAVFITNRTITNSLQEKGTVKRRPDGKLQQFIAEQIINCRDTDAAEAIARYISRNRL